MLAKTLALAVAAGVLLTAGHFSGAADSPYFAPEPPAIANAPFSAVLKTQSVTVFVDGNRIVRTNAVRYFRDSQGRTRTERGALASDGSSTGAALITINDPVGAQRYTLFPQAKVAVVRPLGAEATSPATTEPRDNLSTSFALLGFGMGIGAKPSTEASVSETSLGEGVFQGVKAVGTRVIRTIPSKVLGNQKPIVSTLESWLSPDLGVPVQITQRSSIGGEFTLTLEQIVRTEPDPALFTPPDDYQRHEIRLPVPAPAQAQATVVNDP